jgi:hypothetical protein
MFGEMALDWTQEMERRLYEKMCGRLTCFGGKRKKQEVGRAPIFMILQMQPCLADPARKLEESIFGSRYFGKWTGQEKAAHGHVSYVVKRIVEFQLHRQNTSSIN